MHEKRRLQSVRYRAHRSLYRIGIRQIHALRWVLTAPLLAKEREASNR
jgi:hypothetical protein